ncbi:hypothetical protein [Methylocella tundrae]|uniref:hypothetical protein n=1 Tax=Methylocella tundrae TaxID=227605 RepID=UPI00157AC698
MAFETATQALDRVSFRMLSRRHPMTSSSGVSAVLRRSRGPIGASAVPERERHFATVVRLSP